MKKIGLTGNIAAGKSTASRRLGQLGADIIDADTISHQLTEPGQKTWQAIWDTFGKAYFTTTGILDRKALGNFVFQNEDALQTLNSISHDAIFEVICQRLKDSTGEVAVVDAALLIQTPLKDILDEIWLVTAPDEVRCRRLIDRDGFSKSAAWDRIHAQIPQETLALSAQHILVNDDDKANLFQQVDMHYRRLLEEK